jgi:hypothetical protein
MDRRKFLKRSGIALGAASMASVLAACGDPEEPSTGPDAADIPEGEATLAPTIATFEFLTGPPRLVPFGLRTLDNVEVRDADVTVYVRTPEGEVIAGPFDTRYTEATGTGLGLYVAEFGLEKPGPVDLVAVEGERYGTTAVKVVAPEQSEAPVPGQTAVVVATPTEAKDLGYDSICTQDPPCGMHETSLEDALRDHKPVMLIFATPEFCQTVVCGPAVGTVDSVRKGGDWGDTVWIHTEIYSHYDQEKPELGDPVTAWKLPTEPWLFSIDAKGTIGGRLDGPMLPEMIEDLAKGLTA